MKKLLSSLFFAGIATSTSFSQNWNVDSFQYDGANRIFKTYHNNATQSNMSVVLMLHGLGGTMDDVDLTGFTSIADTANVLFVSPQALDFEHSILGNLGGAWNSGIKVTGTFFGDIELNPNVDDVGFLQALLDSVIVNFDVDPAKIYITGFSNGAFMTQRMLCETPTLFRAAVSHSGTKALPLTNCENNQIPVAHFHGTTDEVVDMQGNFYMLGLSSPVGISVDSLIKYWGIRNNASQLANTVIIGNQTANNYITHYEYAGTKRVEFFEIKNGLHQWYNFNTTNNTFDLGKETWDFFLRADQPVGLRNKLVSNVSVFPNPASGKLQINSNGIPFDHYTITDASGRIVAKDAFQNEINIQLLTEGLYFLQLQSKDGQLGYTKFIKK